MGEKHSSRQTRAAISEDGFWVRTVVILSRGHADHARTSVPFCPPLSQRSHHHLPPSFPRRRNVPSLQNSSSPFHAVCTAPYTIFCAIPVTLAAELAASFAIFSTRFCRAASAFSAESAVACFSV